MLQRTARWIEGRAGTLLPALLLIAFWHPTSSRQETLPPELAPAEQEATPPRRHFLAPDAHRILVEASRGRLLFFRGSSLMAVYPTEPTRWTPQGRLYTAYIPKMRKSTL